MITCPRCQAVNNAGAFFCYTCGKYFVEVKEGKAEKGSDKHDPATPPPAPKAKVLMPGGFEIVLTGTPTFIERSDFDSTLPHDLLMSISRQHVLITFDNAAYYVQDYGRDGKGSTNHTRLNNTDICNKGRQPLKDGDKIELSGQAELTLTFKLL